MTPPPTTRLLLLGAGRSAAALLDYLLVHAPGAGWALTVADVAPAHLAPVLAAHAAYARAVPLDAQNETRLDELVAEADLVISLLPPPLHPTVARACLRHRRHLATASYVSPDIQALHEEAKAAGLIFLMECGLDPGLDHLSACRVIDEVQGAGGRFTAFRSYCGGLVALASEGDNPWRYKISWNPRNVVLAGQGRPAQFREGGRVRYLPYHQLFGRAEMLEIPGHGHFEGYANRDSLPYAAAYGLPADLPTLLRGTLRRPGYCRAWQALVSLGLTDDTLPLSNPATLPWRALVESFLPAASVDSYQLSDNKSVAETSQPPIPNTQYPIPDNEEPATSNQQLATQLAAYLGLDPRGPEMQRLVWLGLLSEAPVGRAGATAAQLLERLLVEKWALGPHDRDQVVLHHEFEYELGGQARRRTSSLVVTGLDARRTAMAQTVGLPLGMAVRRVLAGQVAARGVVIPTGRALYEPILAELAADYGIAFTEVETPRPAA